MPMGPGLPTTYDCDSQHPKLATDTKTAESIKCCNAAAENRLDSRRETEMAYTRRSVLAGLGLAGLGAVILPLGEKVAASSVMKSSTTAEVGTGACPFRLAVINDEITQDFERACQIVSGDFGLRWIELRSMWNKNLTELDDKEIGDALNILEQHKLRVTDIASPLFKTDWPGAPRSSQSESRDQFHADFDAGAQDRLLEH